jgi:trimethylamine--corrinoid protein Co-methyltransferase
VKMGAERWLPLVRFPGLSGPITLAGAIAQSSAESLAGVVIHPLTNRGAPIMAGSSILPMDMRRADLAYGSPELMLAGMGAVDYFNSIGRPSWVGAGCSDFHLPDMQAAAEVGSNMAHRFAAGIAVDDETLAFDAVKRCVSGNGFITGGHTIERYETEMWLRLYSNAATSIFGMKGVVANWVRRLKTD